MRTLNQDALDQVSAQVDTFTAQGATFTALHVTNALRTARLWAGTYGHVDGIAPAVRNLFSNGAFTSGYSSTMVPVNGASVIAYHPVTDDPFAVDLSQTVLPRVDFAQVVDTRTAVTVAAPSGATYTAPVTVAPVASATPRVGSFKDLYNGGRDAVDGDTCTVSINGDGYLQVPRAMVRNLGWAGNVTVADVNGQVFIRPATASDLVIAGIQPTGSDLRIRDTKLMSYGRATGDTATLRLDVSGNQIEVV
jgi:hypothetical protein